MTKEIPEIIPSYIPKSWVVLKLPNYENEYKIFAELDRGTWRLNSGIKSIEEFPDHYYVYGHSGSPYQCFKDCEYVSKNNQPIFSRLVEQGATPLLLTDIPEKFQKNSNTEDLKEIDSVASPDLWMV